MTLYEIKEHKVELFPIRYACSALNCTRIALLKKEERGHLPPANFRNTSNQRLYSIEDLAILEYMSKEIWPHKQGSIVPQWVKNLLEEALAQSKRVVIQWGKSQGPEDWLEIDKKYNTFSRYRLQIYIDSWRRRLVDTPEFFLELVDEEE